MSIASAVGRLAAAHWALAAVCALFLIVGLVVADDYATSMDMGNQRAIGTAPLNYLAGEGERALERVFAPQDRYYGAVFETPVVLIQRILSLDDPGSIRMSKRVLTHLFFLFGGVFCYLLIYRLFNNRPLALIAAVLFLLAPRIYAHSFFNSKDVPFLVMFMISLYLVHRAFRRDTLAAFLLCGVGIGLLVNLRVMGIVLFAAMLGLRALDLAVAGSVRERGRVLLTGGAFALMAALAYYASLPVLWTDPLGRFAEVVPTTGGYATAPLTLFRGEWRASADGAPFDYVPVWVGITIPPAILLLATTGAALLAWRGLRHPREGLRDGPLRFGLLLLILPAGTVVAVVATDGVLYHGWRHLYFLYAPLLLLAVFALQRLASLPSGRWMRVGAYALAGGAVVVAIVSMVRIHPYQYNYFNALADRTTPERLATRYGIYWDGFVRALIDDISKDHPSEDVYVTLNLKSLGGDRTRFIQGKDFRSGRNNFYVFGGGELVGGPCPAAARPVYVSSLYANTLHCVADPVAYFGEMRRRALATEPLDRSYFNAHRVGDVLVYLRDGCTPDDTHEYVFLHVFPVDAADLPPRFRGDFRHRLGYAFEQMDFSFISRGVRIDGNCVAVAALPDYPIARIRTGQHTTEYAETLRRTLAAVEPWVRARYDIHLDPVERLLIFVREECAEGIGEGFFLHVYPVDADSLPDWRREDGAVFDVLDHSLGGRHTRDGACVVVAPLPGYPIARIRTGQLDSWETRFALTRPQVDLTALAEPLTRSAFDIHRHGDALVYVGEACTAATRFFLHLYPVDPGDLPDARREHGFDNRDFFLWEHGGVEGGRCLAVVPLPDYPVASIRTGQYDGDGQRWAAEFALAE